MEQRAMLVGIELVNFKNEKGEVVKFTRLHLVDSATVKELNSNFLGRHCATVNTTRFEQDWEGYLDQEVVLMYELRLGSKTPRFSGMKLA